MKKTKAPKTRARRHLRLRLGTVRRALLFAVFVIGLAALLYSVYNPAQAELLKVGEPSPKTYISPLDTSIVDRLATERQRQAAKAQIAPVYSVNLDLQRLVTSAITSAGLPAAVQDFVVSAYQQPSGIRQQGIPSLISQAVKLAPESRQRDVRLLLERHLLPTSQVNPTLTAAAQNAAAAAVKPVMEQLQAGQTIVREGELLTSSQLRTLQTVGLYNPSSEAVARHGWTIATCVLLALLLSLPLLYARRLLRGRLDSQQFIFLATLSILGVGLQRLALVADSHFFVAALVPLLVAVLVSEQAAIAWGVWLSLVISLLAPEAALATLLTTLLGAVSASLLARLFRIRISLLLAGSLGGIIAAAGYSTYSLLLNSQAVLPLLTSCAWIIGGGMLAGILALGLLPLAESNIGFLTEFRLLELSSPSSPLLQKLLLEAPGTYQHSLIISNLVEQAVLNIGGDALLARVGALYHDIGKLKRPQFFAENQFSGDNPHDQLSPHLSYLIVTSHVRDGIELSRHYKLPTALEPFIAEHHGTTVLAYFYKRALEDSANLDELNFRYAGPRPRSKETAVLMLADAAESASRTLSTPNQSSIRAMIERLIEQRLQDEQLAESPLNFRDLEVITNTFERMLTAVLHRRVNYPSAEEIKGLKKKETRSKDGKDSGRDTRRDPALPLG